ncbi:uncharacterized protein TRIADDRAFT_56568 [Trichoplax adhaerens]|uniref:G-protein coupled receptors family 1 profile domain-containing protein n=1 Tax=Trichoplax adhaerens TaxID=10228 RepID=B3RYI2_TRIAD|nr:hypothetical protein TRIADDRAFT_56568 [Trichoplax adhaerens]EDV24601.1 hypothetical protein TRIADDRAFT_56568 [Trichoplax adhaerens]|eukprot:XP_002112491.1 hypothetical protein TRIADDRAFT_56568 [Trichoplax adhaerens]
MANQTGNFTIKQTYSGEIYVYAIISAITFLTNTIMFCFIVFERKMHIKSNWILASMFCTGIIYALAYLLPRWVMFVPWDLLDSYACQILPLLGSALIINFNLHLVLVSLDRYCCILFPFQYNMPQASVITRWAIFAVWLISFASASIPLFTFLVPIPGMCIIQLNSRSFHIYTLSAYIALFYVPIFILGLAHSRILWIVSIHTKRRHEIFAVNNSIPASVLRRNLRAIAYMAILIGLFLIFWLPSMIYYAILFPTIHLDNKNMVLSLDKVSIKIIH